MRINYLTKLSDLSNTFNYYPFGLVMEGDGMASAANNTEPHNNYQYNGKELQTETGWNDFGARMYDASIGRWMVVDPLAEKYSIYSPKIMTDIFIDVRYVADDINTGYVIFKAGGPMDSVLKSKHKGTVLIQHTGKTFRSIQNQNALINALLRL